ncbi:hypothetical protein ERO13_A13G130701v2 [Gossypium hirsutum]|nr:hypothetical protein ERO13_A13G130701v2 [Gossypium hirsutum]
MFSSSIVWFVTELPWKHIQASSMLQFMHGSSPNFRGSIFKLHPNFRGSIFKLHPCFKFMHGSSPNFHGSIFKLHPCFNSCMYR